MPRFDYTHLKNEVQVKEQAKKDLTELLMKLLKDYFNDKDDGDLVGIVDKNKIGFTFGLAKDRDGFVCDVVATVFPVIMSYQDHVGKKRVTEFYDLQEEIEAYEEYLKIEEKIQEEKRKTN